MDAKYFKEQIADELQGARCYIKKAIELKPMVPAWSKMLVEMSAAELKHADNLYKMFTEYYQKISETYNEVPKYIDDARNEIVDMYTEEKVAVQAMHTMYTQ